MIKDDDKLLTREGCAEIIGSMKDKSRVDGDILSTGTEWDAESLQEGLWEEK